MSEANAAPSDEERIAIAREEDIIVARQRGRLMAEQIGIGGADLTLLATAISEVARNILKYAGKGEVRLSTTTRADRKGVVVVAHDEGPGIPNF